MSGDLKKITGLVFLSNYNIILIIFPLVATKAWQNSFKFCFGPQSTSLMSGKARSLGKYKYNIKKSTVTWSVDTELVYVINI